MAKTSVWYFISQTDEVGLWDLVSCGHHSRLKKKSFVLVKSLSLAVDENIISMQNSIDTT